MYVLGNSVRLLGAKVENGRKAGGASLLLPKIRRNPLIEIIPISTGCLNQCTYCKTKHARGELGSYTPGKSDLYTTTHQAYKYKVSVYKNKPPMAFQHIIRGGPFSTFWGG